MVRDRSLKHRATLAPTRLDLHLQIHFACTPSQFMERIKGGLALGLHRLALSQQAIPFTAQAQVVGHQTFVRVAQVAIGHPQLLDIACAVRAKRTQLLAKGSRLGNRRVVICAQRGVRAAELLGFVVGRLQLDAQAFHVAAERFAGRTDLAALHLRPAERRIKLADNPIGSDLATSELRVALLERTRMLFGCM